jgi:hypothetical protein
MRKPYAAWFILFAVFTLPAHAQSDRPPRLIDTTLLPGYLGDFEHFAVDINCSSLLIFFEAYPN